MEFTEKNLQLVVNELSIGQLKTNAQELKELVKGGLSRYSIDNYTEDNIDEAKKDKAVLNKASKILNDKRLELERQWLQPFGEFKTIVNDTIGLIKEASGKIDFVVKSVELKAAEEKLTEIKNYYQSKKYGEVIAFERIYEKTWMNKSNKLPFVFGEIDGIIGDVKRNIESLESQEEKAHYLETLDIAETLRWNRARIERLAAIKRMEAEQKAKIEKQNTSALESIQQQQQEVCQIAPNKKFAIEIAASDDEAIISELVRRMKEDLNIRKIILTAANQYEFYIKTCLQ